MIDCSMPDSENTKISKSSNQRKIRKDDNKKIIKELSLEISKLSYEDSIKELDSILSQLQNETLLVEELKLNYLKAKLYLEHSESLLIQTEQDVIHINSTDS